MNVNEKYHPIVEELVKMIAENDWTDKFEQAIKKANTKNLPFLERVKNLNQYLNWINDFLYWIPTENSTGQNVDDHLSAFYFIADQEPILSLQNKIVPYNEMPPLTPFSQWLVNYANAMGLFLDSPESWTPESEATFYSSTAYNMKEYLKPRGGWKSFNQFFARNFKPGYRPTAAIADQTIIVSPVDATFGGVWEIRKDANVTVKNLNWKISELLESSPYKECFEGGLFMHTYLGPTDYHRQHAPVGGKVLEARVIQGQVYLEVSAKTLVEETGKHRIHHKRIYDSQDNTGYQFAQTRGLIVLDTPIGLVAILPIGMCQVSSVIITAEVGVTLRKGEEISYFQFGGSDCIVLFQSAANICFSAQTGIHYKVGNKIAEAYCVI